MLRLGLTGDLGSGKSTVAKLLAARGAIVLSSDEMARTMMQPGEAVYEQIVARFGVGILAADKTLDRKQLAALAFNPVSPRVTELNAIIHPAVIAEQARTIESLNGTDKIVVVESALIFSAVTHDQQSWQTRFDRILLVTAPLRQKVERFDARQLRGRTASAEELAALRDDARQRLAMQDAETHATDCVVIHNDGDFAALESHVATAWADLKHATH